MKLTIYRHSFRVIYFCLALLVALGGSAQAYRKPKNPRRTTAASKKPEVAMPPLAGRWAPEVRAAIRKLIAERGSNSDGYDEQRPPVAVVAWSRAGIVGDAAEAVFFNLVTKAQFHFTEEFWKKIPLAYGSQRIRAAHEQFYSLPMVVWKDQPAYRQYRKTFLKSYRDMCARVGQKECRSYLAQLLVGFKHDDAVEYARGVLKREAAVKTAVEFVTDEPGDAAPLQWPRGLAVVPEIKNLVATLREEGFDVWAVGLDAQPTLEASANLGGIDATRCLGIKQKISREKFTGEVIDPVPIRGGEVEAVASSIGRVPALVIAGGLENKDLLEYGGQVKIIIGSQTVSGALIQPPFH